jgi:nitroreductase
MKNPFLWRYATQKFDPTKKISKAHLKELLDVLRLTPSSYGLQPWKFIIVENAAIRRELRQYAWGQPQITDASHLLVLCAKREIDDKHIKSFITHTEKAREVKKGALGGFEQAMRRFVKGQSAESLGVWMAYQVYIALGVLLCECAHRGIDSCPMEGFDMSKFAQILKLDGQGLKPTVLCAIGYRAKDDPSAAFKKVRFPEKDVLVFKR